MKSMLVTLLTSLVLVATAHADGQRVLVVMKSQQTFKAADAAFKARGEFALKNVNLGFGAPAKLAAVNANVEDSLSNINTLVVNVKDSSEIAKLKSNPDVAFVETEVMHPAPRPYRGFILTADSILRKKPVPSTPVDPGTFTVTDKTPWGISAVHAPQAWALSHAGQGVRVLVLDTGIDKDHPSLKANFEQGRDFVGDSNTPYAFADHEGHGTHVSGTIAGVQDASGFTGVAPQAKILMGRVCSEEGCSNIAIAQGINWGIQQKVDVISMSLGGAMSTPAERSAVAQADKAGVTVVAAAGNDGDQCSGSSCTVSYPAALPTAIAVGAVDSTLAKASFSQYGPELAVVAPGVAVVSSVPQGTGREPNVQVTIDGKAQAVASTTFEGDREALTPETNTLVDCGLGKPEDFQKVDVKGKYALISRGEINFGDKVKNAIAAGAVGAIIYNNTTGLLQGTLKASPTDPNLDAAVFMVEQSVGQAMVKALAGGQDVSATVVVKQTDYASFDGTSMATPHVAGVVALIKGANKALKPADVKSILKSTAHALGPNANNEFGAGIVQADAAVQKAANQ
jgi:subtilisin family serine protease